MGVGTTYNAAEGVGVAVLGAKGFWHGFKATPGHPLVKLGGGVLTGAVYSYLGEEASNRLIEDHIVAHTTTALDVARDFTSRTIIEGSVNSYNSAIDFTSREVFGNAATVYSGAVDYTSQNIVAPAFNAGNSAVEYIQNEWLKPIQNWWD